MVLGLRKRQAEPIADPVEAAHGSPAVVDDEKRVDTGVAQSSGINLDDDAIVEDSVDQLKKFQKLHQWDLNLPMHKLNAVDAALDSEDVEKKVNVEHSLLEENSPYPEVVSAVRNYDE
jgi:hypothetical protein